MCFVGCATRVVTETPVVVPLFNFRHGRHSIPKGKLVSIIIRNPFCAAVPFGIKTLGIRVNCPQIGTSPKRVRSQLTEGGLSAGRRKKEA